MAYRAKPDSEPDWDDEARGRTPTSTNPKAAPAQPKRAVTPGEVRKRAVANHASAPRPVFGIAPFASAMLVVVILAAVYRDPIAGHFNELDKARREASSPERRRDTDRTGAWAYMQIFVEKRLKSPSSASYPWFGSDDAEVTSLGNGTYRIRSWVDSSNSFGAVIRTRFEGVIEKSLSGKSWHLVSLDF